MKRMINQELIDYIRSLYDNKLLGADEASNTLEVGGNLEVDGDLRVNGDINAQVIRYKVPELEFDGQMKIKNDYVYYGGEATFLFGTYDNIAKQPFGVFISGYGTHASNGGNSTAIIGLTNGKVQENAGHYFPLIVTEITFDMSGGTVTYFMNKPIINPNNPQAIIAKQIFNNNTYQYTNNEESIANQAFKTITLSGMTDYDVAITSIEVVNASDTAIDGVIVSMPKWNGTAWDVTLYNLSGASISDFKVNVTYHNILDN